MASVDMALCISNGGESFHEIIIGIFDFPYNYIIEYVSLSDRYPYHKNVYLHFLEKLI